MLFHTLLKHKDISKNNSKNSNKNNSKNTGRLITKAVGLHRPSGYTGRLVTQASWVTQASRLC